MGAVLVRKEESAVPQDIDNWMSVVGDRMGGGGVVKVLRWLVQKV